MGYFSMYNVKVVRELRWVFIDLISNVFFLLEKNKLLRKGRLEIYVRFKLGENGV